MFEQLKKLLNLYKNNIDRFKFENEESNVIEFIDKKFDSSVLSISLNRINNFYYIFLYIEEDNKIIFKGLLNKSDNNIKNIFDVIINDLTILDLEDFISKYYEDLEKNFS